jgi:2-dehydropantoate 2-reductase
MKSIRICIAGAGAVGGHLAALLAPHYDVSVLARGEHLLAIRANGIYAEVNGNRMGGRVKASNSTYDLGQQDYVLVTVKSYALNELLNEIQPLLGTKTAVVFLQNGIPWWYAYAGRLEDSNQIGFLDPGARFASAIGKERLIGGITANACRVVEPGVIEVSGDSKSLVIGEPNGAMTERLDLLRRMLEQAGQRTECTNDILTAVWIKLVQNLGSAPLSVLLPMPVNELYGEPACVTVRLAIQAEVQAVARAWGCAIDLDLQQQLGYVKTIQHIPSIAQDILAGKSPELDALLNSPLMMASLKNVPTPMLSLMTGLAKLKIRTMGLEIRKKMVLS